MISQSFGDEEVQTINLRVSTLISEIHAMTSGVGGAVANARAKANACKAPAPPPLVVPPAPKPVPAPVAKPPVGRWLLLRQEERLVRVSYAAVGRAGLGIEWPSWAPSWGGPFAQAGGRPGGGNGEAVEVAPSAAPTADPFEGEYGAPAPAPKPRPAPRAPTATATAPIEPKPYRFGMAPEMKALIYGGAVALVVVIGAVVAKKKGWIKK
jgi:hypothetical protein